MDDPADRRRQRPSLEELRLAPRTAWRRLGGGSICEVWQASSSVAGTVVLKRTPYDPRIEASGLEALAAAGAPVPAVLAVEPPAGGWGWLALEHVAGPPDWVGVGRSLAALHRCGGSRFGWHADNLIGSLPQRGGWWEDWPAFYAECRIGPHLDAPSLPGPVRGRLERALEGPLLALLDHGAGPSLVHGDLWSGNVVGGRWLIDPAVCYVDREHELAFMALFGGFPGELWKAYTDAWPLDPGWRARRPALQLYHLLVHVRLFGGTYVGAVTDRLDALGW